LPHIDTKKLGRIERPSHRVTGNRRDSVEGAAYGRFWPRAAAIAVRVVRSSEVNSLSLASCSELNFPVPNLIPLLFRDINVVNSRLVFARLSSYVVQRLVCRKS